MSWYWAGMTIDELDEFQGVTPQLVTGWLLANGWKQTKPRWWERGEDGFLFDSETFDQPWFWTHALAAIYTAGNVQALLCKINPRMRAGCPGTKAIDDHASLGGMWLARRGKLGNGGTLVLVSFNALFEDGVVNLAIWDRDEYEELVTSQAELAEEGWAFWPCDDHGNKLRWSTDAQGNML